jgi:hypothetical protein
VIARTSAAVPHVGAREKPAEGARCSIARRSTTQTETSEEANGAEPGDRTKVGGRADVPGPDPTP